MSFFYTKLFLNFKWYFNYSKYDLQQIEFQKEKKIKRRYIYSRDVNIRILCVLT